MDSHAQLRFDMGTLTMKEMEKSLPRGTLSSAQKRSRTEMMGAVSLLSHDQQEFVRHAARAKRLRTTAVAEDIQPPLATSPVCPGDDRFFHTVSDDCRNERICKFIDATGNKALQTSVCVACAGRFWSGDTEVVKLDDLKKNQRLVPTHSHPEHVLTDGMLLHLTSVQTDAKGFSVVSLCNNCLSYLRRHKTPPLSLANGLWIGDVPLELKILTLPERVLIARFFPAAYIVKLYPKKKGARFWANASFHCGLRGNVSTYRLNTDDIAAMVGDNVLPPPASILAATIGVTFVGPKNVPQKTMPGFLRVNRNRVRQALRWLKRYNPVYREIRISESRLEELPADDIPHQILSLVKHSENTDQLAAEHDGYVPENDADDTGEWLFHLT
jgi:hypothetical protein